MQTDNEQLHLSFHGRANTIFFTLLAEFEEAVSKINRRKEEQQFKQTKDQYILALQQQLETCAGQILQEHPNNKKPEELNQNLQQFIKQYLHLFVQKTRAF